MQYTKRLQEIDKEIIGLSSDSGRLAQLLSEISQHVSSEECPVCNRDYSETHTTHSLQEHVNRRIQELSNQASKLHQLHKERKEKQEVIGAAERRLSEIESKAIEHETIKKLEERQQLLNDLARDILKINE